jgi:hypothetical protein
VSATGVDHRDVAAFALGILDDPDAAAFEAHLSDCARCAAELETFLDLSTALADADLDADTVVTTMEATEDGRLLQRLLNSVAYQRTKVRTMRILTAAAAFVLIAGVAVTGVFAGQQLGSDKQDQVAQGGDTRTPSEQATGGPTGKAGEPFQTKYHGTNPATKTTAEALLVGRNWGSEVWLEVRNFKAKDAVPCQLVVIAADGHNEIAGIWTIPAGEYGTNARPAPLTIMGIANAQRADIKRIELRSTATSGPAMVVTVDT